MSEPVTKAERDALLARAAELERELYPPEGGPPEPSGPIRVKLLDRYYQVLHEYGDRLPRMPFSRCPHSNQVLRRSIDPWRRLGFAAGTMAAYLGAQPECGALRLIRTTGSTEETGIAGVVSVRYPWLRGPYLELLVLFAPFQGLGVGAAILAWIEAETLGRAGSLWVCTSDFNVRARAFYEANGFVRVADLDGLVGPGFTEILLRKRF